MLRAPTPPDQLVDKRGRPYFLWDVDMTLSDWLAKVNGPDAGAYPQSGQERVRAIQKVIDLEKQYAPVRERIAAEKADAGKGGAPPPKKK